MKGMIGIFKKVNNKQCSEFGQVLVLVCTGLGLYHKDSHYIVAAFWAMLITILIPRIFFPFAVSWFGMAEILNRISSWLVLHILFFMLVMPMGLFRKWTGKDSMKLKQFKKSRVSVMTVRDHLYEASDLKNTF
jgi:hypothetical protein